MSKQLKPLIFLLTGVSAVALLLILSANSGQKNVSASVEDIKQENGVQVIDIRAKGGYTPNLIEAKAATPGKLRVTTNNTFDCSLALVIPKLGVRKNLPINGISDFDIPPQTAGSEIDGSCSMGMYSFRIKFV